MRAVQADVTGPPTVMHVTEVADPEPGEGEAAVDVQYAGVGFVDTLFRNGTFSLPLPLTPGIEVAGTVRAVGPGVTGLRVGQPVAALLNDFGRGSVAGGYAEVAIARADLTCPLPAGLDPALAAAILVNGTTAELALNQLARLQAGERVVILGVSGGIGSVAARIAAAAGASQIIGVIGREAKRAAAQAAGCSDIVLSQDLASQIPALTGGAGADVVFDPVGGSARQTMFGLLAPFGRLVIVGNASGEDVLLSTDAAWLGSQTVTGLSVGGIAHLQPGRVQAAGTAVLDRLAQGRLTISPPQVEPFARAADVHQALEESRAASKVVLIPG